MTVELNVKVENEMTNLDEAIAMLETRDEINATAKKRCKEIRTEADRIEAEADRIEAEAKNRCKEIKAEMLKNEDEIIKEICENMTKYFKILKSLGYTTIDVINEQANGVKAYSSSKQINLPLERISINSCKYRINDKI